MVELKLAGGETPLYQQIIDAILEEISTGALRPGDKLLSVRELAAQMQISSGTVKHAYDQLEQAGAIEMRRGSGTYVMGGLSFEARTHAIAAIQRLLHELNGMQLPDEEIGRLWEEVFRLHRERKSRVQVALVECNPETMRLIESQLAHLPHVEVRGYLLDEVLQNPAVVGKGTDLLLTTPTHADAVLESVAAGIPLTRMALMPTQQSVAQISLIPSGELVGVLTQSELFAQIIQRNCRDINPELVCEFALLGDADATAQFLGRHAAVIVPSNYPAICSAEEQALLANHGNIILFTYQPDKGSFMYLEEKLNQLLEQKNTISIP